MSHLGMGQQGRSQQQPRLIYEISDFTKCPHDERAIHLDPKCSTGDLPYNQYGTKTKAAHLSPFIVVSWHTGKNSVYSPCRR